MILRIVCPPCDTILKEFRGCHQQILLGKGPATIFSRLRQTLIHQEPPFDTWAKPSAVMVVLAERPRPSVLLILRPDSLGAHAGQIACPGGRFERARDANLVTAALRETEEEVGIRVPVDHVLGFLEPIHIRVTGYTLLPVVAGFGDRPPVIPQVSEVSDYAWVTLAELARVRRERPRDFAGVTLNMAEFPIGLGTLWGATARIVDQLLQQLAQKGA